MTKHCRIKSTENLDNVFNIRTEWMNGLEVSHALGMSYKTLLRLRKSGALPYSKVNGKIYFKREDVDKLLEKNYRPFYCICCNRKSA
ncbi:MAG: helix-turn-helix domain-containing protein [Crocinitomicaceae bacterium]